jgi:preprotein translocase subunit SecB
MAKKRVKTKVLKSQNKVPAGLLVSERVQLKDVRLISCKCDQAPEATLGKKDYGINYSTKVQVDKKNGYIIVTAIFHFKAFTESKTQKPVILIDASFLLAYKIENFEGLTQKGFEQFANLNGIYNAWPYWREFVQNTVTRMGLPSLTIPVFRIVHSTTKKSIKRKTVRKKTTKRTISRK